jgi:hypothetical protein
MPGARGFFRTVGERELFEGIACEGGQLAEANFKQDGEGEQEGGSRSDQPSLDLGVGGLGNADLAGDVVLGEGGAVAGFVK